ncbi:MAG: bifunctional methylenetetrahydrofolate dehydrogenase/methenyltetrahydrofolate cyclohydrolase FolD [Pseudomonadales bacterium]|nr:bifunctional methylenetetrahydrofolate dehydrogenase/methenyltetrahydrofolate cyclohydrolase FolD [Pseudomonadales bacterium]
MTARIIDGKAIAASIRHDLKKVVDEMKVKGERIPGLAVILVGNDPASNVYVRGKRRDCEEVGFKSDSRSLNATTTEAELLGMIEALNNDPTIDGILVQLPLPEHIDPLAVMEAIHPNKDVDGFHPYNVGRLVLRHPGLRPCTPMGVMELLNRTHDSLLGMDATVIGVSNHVGRPMALELLLQGCSVAATHRFTNKTEEYVRYADIVISAVGIPGLIKGEWIKPGATVIDVGITRDANGKLKGDVEFEEASKRAGWITPVPGGVGPMTRVSMLQNVLYAKQHFHS